MTIHRRVTIRNFCPIRLTESQPGGLSVAISLNRPGCNRQVVVECLNFSKQPVKLRAVSVIGTFTRVEMNKVDDQLLRTASKRK